jgi:hypothetical protein
MTFPVALTNPAQANAPVVVNENLGAIGHQGVYAKNYATCAGLVWGYHGGRWGGNSIADGTHTLNASSTVYQVVLRSSGASSISTSATNWNDTANYARVYKFTTSGSAVTAVEDHRAGPSGVHGMTDSGTPTESIIIAVSDETTALTTGTAKVTFRMPYAFSLSGIKASVTTAPTGADLIVDVNEAGSTLMTTNKLRIDATEKTTATAATPPTLTDTALADDAEITIDIDQVGSTVAGAGLKVYLIGRRT